MKKTPSSWLQSHISKKCIAPVIATVLLLLITIVAGIGGYNWYQGFTQNYEAKKLQGYTTTIEDSITVMALKSESSTYNLYIKNSLTGYIIINQLKVNGNDCVMNKNNVVFSNSITPINITCPSIVRLNNITIYTDIGIIDVKKSLS